MSQPYARIRVRRAQAELLLELLRRERGIHITSKIAARESGEDTASLRARLNDLRYLIEEAERAIEDISIEDAPG